MSLGGSKSLNIDQCSFFFFLNISCKVFILCLRICIRPYIFLITYSERRTVTQGTCNKINEVNFDFTVSSEHSAAVEHSQTLTAEFICSTVHGHKERKSILVCGNEQTHTYTKTCAHTQIRRCC